MRAFPLSRAALLRAACAALWLGVATASPATDLYRSALDRISSEYYGWSTADLRALDEKYAAILAQQCEPTLDACAYDTGRAVLTDLLREFGDAHTNVRDPEGAERLREVTQDLAVQRTGARLVRVEGGLLVVSVMPGSPAEQTGLATYDLLTQVNGQDAGKRAGQNSPVGPNEFIRLERTGTPIQVTRRRSGLPAQVLTLSTARLKARDVPTLSWAGPDGRTAVITYPTFLSQDAAELFVSRLVDAQRAGARQLVVDLRYNSGGSLGECVAAASTFQPVYYKTQFRNSSYTYSGVNGVERRGFTRPPEAGSALWHGPAAILVGPNTASCAEVFTYYAQKAGAVVVGENTRGVGNSGVTFEPLPDGGVLSVTILKAFTPDDRPLPDHITPDIEAPTDVAALVDEGRDTTLQAALDALAAQATR